MNNMKTKKISALLAAFILCVSVICPINLTWAQESTNAPADEELYAAAVKDAVTIESEELEYELEPIAADNNNMIFDEQGRVLMGCYNKYPDSYVAGEQAVLQWGEVWVFSMGEMQSWYAIGNNGLELAENSARRFEQLLGLPPNDGKTHFSAFWTDVKDLTRPAYNTDIESSECLSDFHSEPDSNFMQWFEDNINWSYTESAYPWTRIGYTYDWADNGTEYGLSEYLINSGSTVEIEFTYTTEEFINYLAHGSLYDELADDSLVTRGMLVAELAQSADADVESIIESTFSDVDNDYEYMKYVQWAADKGIVAGMGDGRFEPNRFVTREEMAVILYNFANIMGCELSEKKQTYGFAADEKISSWADLAVDKLYAAEIILSRSDGSFAPKAPVTAEETAEAIERLAVSVN